MPETLLIEALAAITLVGVITFVLGNLLRWSPLPLRAEEDSVVAQIDALLPQTQCGQCGHPGCRPYAAAIAAGKAPINRCLPGGHTTIATLTDLLGCDPEPLDGTAVAPMVALIREAECIGCTKCIQACPVDAILGAAQHMHTVITAECTGCDLCLEPCPVDCIELHPRNPAISSSAEASPKSTQQHLSRAVAAA